MNTHRVRKAEDGLFLGFMQVILALVIAATFWDKELGFKIICLNVATLVGINAFKKMFDAVREMVIGRMDAEPE